MKTTNLNPQPIMASSNGHLHAGDILRELEWFDNTLRRRIAVLFNQGTGGPVESIPMPDLSGSDSAYAATVRAYGLEVRERLVLAAVLAADLRPSLLLKYHQSAQEMPELGLVPGPSRNTFCITVRTALFLAGSLELLATIGGMDMFGAEHPFVQHRIIQQIPVPQGGFFDTRLAIDQEFLLRVTTGRRLRPDYSADFPARYIHTEMRWEELVLPHRTMQQVEEIRVWLRHGKALRREWGMSAILKKGYRSLFYGPPGTGKTLTAQLLGKVTGLDVYRIDLSQVVSKYIGETEKNLSHLFNQAEGKDWILFFDEADSLFGKRGKVSDARDRYANQEVSYLLQRIEDFDGLVILASNLKGNIDEAFARRFQGMIYFPLPDPRQRLQLWENALPDACRLESGLTLAEIAQAYELAGGSIVNIVGYVALMARERGDAVISRKDLLEGIRREYHKEGKSM
ncbi:MAG: ATP-binding protein [Bacteroidota bacterium]